MTATRMSVKFMMTARALALPKTLAQCAAMTAEPAPVITPPTTVSSEAKNPWATPMAHSV